MQKITKQLIKSKLTEVLDPELNISIVDLGLIYKVEFFPPHPRGGENHRDGENRLPGGVKVTMTLTTIGCPLFDLIESEMRNKLKRLGLKDKNIKIELTFDPPWSMDKMTKRGKTMLGI